jgi:hypothetical protein
MAWHVNLDVRFIPQAFCLARKIPWQIKVSAAQHA